jgi:hypothetical protein
LEVLRVIAMHTYINEHGTEATTMHIHPDSESLEFHMEVAAQRINQGIDMLPTGRIDLFGKPSDQLMQQLEQNAESWPMIAKSHVQGFTRPLAG